MPEEFQLHLISSAIEPKEKQDYQDFIKKNNLKNYQINFTLSPAVNSHPISLDLFLKKMYKFNDEDDILIIDSDFFLIRSIEDILKEYH